ncbi:hypothetical protein A8B75_11640 [Sphingomonadales bacterium EhC05]|nr:hypothetical protein A8B75_11640 [Sphingomonadales bacterium EhC05]
MASLGEVEAILLTATIAAILAVWGIITQRVVARRVATLNHLARVDADNDLIDARKMFIKLTNDDGAILKYADPATFDTDEATSVRLVLNEHERLAIGMQFGVLDREYIKRTWRGTLIRDFTLAAPFIYKLRQHTKNPAIYHEFEELVRSLVDKKMPKRWYWTKLWF